MERSASDWPGKGVPVTDRSVSAYKQSRHVCAALNTPLACQNTWTDTHVAFLLAVQGAGSVLIVLYCTERSCTALCQSVRRPGIPIDNMCTSFSAMGSAVILPLDPEKGYQFEVAIFGGGTQVRCSCSCSCRKKSAQQQSLEIHKESRGSWAALLPTDDAYRCQASAPAEACASLGY